MSVVSVMSSRILACFACLAISAHTVNAAEAEPEPPVPSTTVIGRFVLPPEPPTGVAIENVRIEKLTGEVRRQVADVALPYPEGYDGFTQEEKRAWLKKFYRSSLSMAYLPAVIARAAEQKRIPPIPIAFTGDGRFVIKDLPPGKWVIEARIPHDTLESLSHAICGSTFELTGESNPLDLGDLMLSLRPALAPGDEAPDFAADTYDGKQFRLSDYRGKFVLLDFWATWCRPCVAELPNLEAVHKEFAGERFAMIGLSLDETIDDARAFEEQNPSAHVHGYLGDRTSSDVYDLYGIQMIPSIWLIGPDGKIIARDLRGTEVREAVKSALDGAAASN